MSTVLLVMVLELLNARNAMKLSIIMKLEFLQKLDIFFREQNVKFLNVLMVTFSLGFLVV